MDLYAIGSIPGYGINGVSGLSGVGGLPGVGSVLGGGTLTGTLGEKVNSAEGTVFDSFLNAAIDNINTTNNLLSAAEDEEIRFALGEVDNTHDLAIALQKASTALQYTVAVRDKLMESYKEIMQMQI